jgi:hypothetical protein
MSSSSRSTQSRLSDSLARKRKEYSASALSFVSSAGNWPKANALPCDTCSPRAGTRNEAQHRYCPGRQKSPPCAVPMNNERNGCRVACASADLRLAPASYAIKSGSTNPRHPSSLDVQGDCQRSVRRGKVTERVSILAPN